MSACRNTARPGPRRRPGVGFWARAVAGVCLSGVGLSCLPAEPAVEATRDELASTRMGANGTRPAELAIRIPEPTSIAAVVPDPAASDAEWDVLPDELLDDGSDDDVLDADRPFDDAAQAPMLAATARETWVYAEPRWGARRIGYLRAGARVVRDEEPAGDTRCKGGWYRVQPKGFVCANKHATLDVFDPIVEASQPRPKRDGLPYQYVMSRFPTPPLYAALPSQEDQERHERGLEAHLRKYEALQKNADFVAPPDPEAVPPALLYGQHLPRLTNERPTDKLLLGHARVRSGFALLSQFEHDGRRFGLTTELAVIPLDRTRYIEGSRFHGIELDDEITLPVAFVMSRHATRLAYDEEGALIKKVPLAYREAVPLTGRVRGRGEGRLIEATDGTWLKESQVVRVDPMRNRPAWSNGKRKWIDVSILRQSLVAYEGDKPVYVTLVSTGADGIADHEDSHATIQGTFLIHTKHVSTTMDSDSDSDDPFDLRDVPFVQYFTEGYALHAAYWHDDFGRPRSHGCVNLAPIDAARLFQWTTPDVPDDWHGALSLKQGTLVHTHP